MKKLFFLSILFICFLSIRLFSQAYEDMDKWQTTQDCVLNNIQFMAYKDSVCNCYLLTFTDSSKNVFLRRVFKNQSIGRHLGCFAKGAAFSIKILNKNDPKDYKFDCVEYKGEKRNTWRLTLIGVEIGRTSKTSKFDYMKVCVRQGIKYKILIYKIEPSVDLFKGEQIHIKGFNDEKFRRYFISVKAKYFHMPLLRERKFLIGKWLNFVEIE